MADVVAHTGLSIDEIAEIHSAPTYHVYALGSHPGYCYLGGMDPRIATPRRKTPVVEHSRGSGVDRRQPDRRLGVGRAERLEHDRQHRHAFLRSRRSIRRRLLRPGDMHSLPDRQGDPMIEILSTGALATVQDLGRNGALKWGVGTSGAMDDLALAAATFCSATTEDAAGDRDPDFSVPGPLPEDCAFAVTGADCGARLDDAAAAAVVGPHGKGRTGASSGSSPPGMPGRASRAYLCLAGGVDVPPVLGSRSTQLRGAFGGLEGRALAPGRQAAQPEARASATDRTGFGLVSSGARDADAWRTVCRPCGCCRPPNTRLCTGSRARRFWAEPWRITPQSDRYGFRLEGTPLHPVRPDRDALARHRAGRDPGAARRTADRADARRAALRRLPEDRHGDRGRSLAARPGADRQPHPLRRSDLGAKRSRLSEQNDRWLDGGAPPGRPASRREEEALTCPSITSSRSAAWLAEAGIDQLELSGPDGTAAAWSRGAGQAMSRMTPSRRSIWRKPKSTGSTASSVSAPAVGILLHRHPMHEAPLAPERKPGTRRADGRPAADRRAAAAGRRTAGWDRDRLLVAHGALVGFGTALVELSATDRENRTMDIDLNADLAEGFGPWRMGDDEALLDVLSSANLACGFHAGDPADHAAHGRAGNGARRRHRRPCRLSGPSGFRPPRHADRSGRTRRDGDLSARRPRRHLPCSAGGRMTHMSFHGALGNMVAADHALAAALVRAVADFDPKLVIVSSGSRAIETAAARLRPEGRHDLPGRPRLRRRRAAGVRASWPDSVIHERELVLERVRRMLDRRRGHHLQRQDAADAAAQHPAARRHAGARRRWRKAIREEIEACGGRIVPVSRQLAQTAAEG